MIGNIIRLSIRGAFLPLSVMNKCTTLIRGALVTPQELYDKLLTELSASGSQKITTPEGEDLTLREAVAQIFGKLRTIYTLADRPRDPGQGDDMYGHVMNARAEGLYTQALI